MTDELRLRVVIVTIELSDREYSQNHHGYRHETVAR